jgi:hypothetical protein
MDPSLEIPDDPDSFFDLFARQDQAFSEGDRDTVGSVIASTEFAGYREHAETRWQILAKQFGWEEDTVPGLNQKIVILEKEMSMNRRQVNALLLVVLILAGFLLLVEIRWEHQWTVFKNTGLPDSCFFRLESLNRSLSPGDFLPLE